MTAQVTHIDDAVLVAYLEKTRWFGGKGRPFAVTGVQRLGRLGDDHPAVDVLLVELTYADVGDDAHDAVEYYQVPLTYYADPEHRLDHAFIGWWEDPDRGWVHAYDALHDREAMALWLSAFGTAGTAASGSIDLDGLQFQRTPGFDVDADATGSLFSGEQSNSSVLFGEDSVFKVFRKITPGPNPDITTHEALTRAGSSNVASLYGWVEHVDAVEGVTHLGMLQQFLRTAIDGWDLALTSVRTLYADPIVEPAESGGDFAGESERLGETLREVHDVLVASFGVGSTPAQEIADHMTARLERAIGIAPALAPHEEALVALYEQFAAIGDVEVQRVHGDLHLGQTLRTALGWKIVDFEGEPAKSLAERLLPDSPWRDVAGMLRSFDYAPFAVANQLLDVDAEAISLRVALGFEWAERNKAAFLGAYAGGVLTDEQQVLVDAYVADKAVYETVYETRNRPTWVGIPLAAVERIGAAR